MWSSSTGLFEGTEQYLTLICDRVALTEDGDIAIGLDSHFESLASSLENEEFDVDHLFIVLLLEEDCKQISGLTEAMKIPLGKCWKSVVS